MNVDYDMWIVYHGDHKRCLSAIKQLLFTGENDVLADYYFVVSIEFAACYIIVEQDIVVGKSAWLKHVLEGVMDRWRMKVGVEYVFG